MASLANATPRQGSFGAGNHAPKIGEDLVAAAARFIIDSDVSDTAVTAAYASLRAQAKA